MGIDVPTFRRTMGLFPGAVTLITTGAGSLRRGITATAVCSVTDDPPSLLACVNNKTGTCKEIQRSGLFSVQLLGQEQADVAMVFAGAGGQAGAEKFAAGEWDAFASGVPRLTGALASVSCAVAAQATEGSHTIFIGRIKEVALNSGEALVYAGSKFRKLVDVA